ncbi:MAG TPA: L,D-transpeptidase family protein [Thermoleophilaceae bacterium]|nr:L,D-transpeptidase family protein [Thermoleophilaceae bacterium]
MISTEQLVAALEELPPHDRELLELSLRRRVPDEALATLFDVEEAEVTRRRANAIDQLSTLLGLRRGEDLGSVLKSLLEERTWAEIGARPGHDEPAGPGGEPRGDQGGDPKPVLELLADRPSPVEEERAPKRRRRLGPAALALGLVAVLGAVIVALALSSGESSDGDGGDPEQRPFEPTAPSKAQGEPFASGSARPIGQNVTATVRGRAVIYSEPGGGKKSTLSPRTQFETPRVFGVVRRKGDWLAVQAPELKNGQVGWLRASDARLDSTPWSLHADLSSKRLEVRKGGRPVRSFSIAIGSPQNPTPKGRFSVTDKLKVTDAGSPYGCCVLALSGHQVDLPPDWPGGDRLAVHATRNESSIGKPVSLGCMRTRAEQARWPINTIPLGSPLFVSA